MNLSKLMTFKQFLSEDELSDLAVGMFLRKKFDIGRAEAQQLIEWLKGEVDYVDIGSDIWQHVLDHFGDEIPHGTKSGDPLFTDEWVMAALKDEMEERGIDVSNL